mmetsp:Transcript_28450/g.61946  ORF Transcript_28450/g.61946 Transcript_28450/m.61946 type:complete len:433 (+) Transcript_28450:128-1426(+)
MPHQVYLSTPCTSRQDFQEDAAPLKPARCSSVTARSTSSVSSSLMAEPSSSHSSPPTVDAETSWADEDVILSRLDAMRTQEDKHYTFATYSLLPLSALAQSGQLQDFTNEPTDASCRAKMVDWQVAVVRHCSFSQECVAVAISNLDRYLSTPQGYKALVDRRQFQLACMTSIYLSIKINEVETITPQGMARVSQDDYTEHEIVECEQEMLAALDWHVNPPTPTAFAELYVSLLRPTDEDRIHEQEQEELHRALQRHVMEYAKMQIEMASREYNFVGRAASSLALAAILNGLSCTMTECVVDSRSIDFVWLTQQLFDKLQLSRDNGNISVDIQTIREELILMFPPSSRGQEDPQASTLEEEHRVASPDGSNIENSLDTSIDDVTKIDDALVATPAALSPRCVGKENSPLQNKHLLGHLLCGMLLPFGLLQDRQ